MVFNFLGIFFGWTWFIWAPVFICTLVSAIHHKPQPPKNEENAPVNWPLFWAALSFTIILGGLTSLIFMAA